MDKLITMKIYFLILISLISISVHAQTDYTGIYNYSFPITHELSDLKPSKEDGGPSGEIILARTSGDNYVFWLNVNRGWPSYNMGFMTGNMEIKNGKAKYIHKDEYSDGSCILDFRIKPLLIEIESQGYEHCGFGHAVYADGTFKKSKKILTSAYLFSTLEGMGDVKEIKSEKAVIYKDSTLQIPTKQYFIRKDKVYTSEMAQKAVFVQYVAKGQKYVSGWIKKEDL